MNKLSIIVAMTDTGVIGKDNDLPWPRNKEDMKHFRKNTMGHALIMGRKTYQSIGKPLKGRHSIVLSSSSFDTPDNVTVVGSIEQALEQAYAMDESPFVIGGASVYRQFLPFSTRLLITEIPGSYDGDTFFPLFVKGNDSLTLLGYNSEWKISECLAGDNGTYKTYELVERLSK